MKTNFASRLLSSKPYGYKGDWPGENSPLLDELKKLFSVVVDLTPLVTPEGRSNYAHFLKEQGFSLKDKTEKTLSTNKSNTKDAELVELWVNRGSSKGFLISYFAMARGAGDVYVGAIDARGFREFKAAFKAKKYCK